METGCWMCQGSETMVDAFGIEIPCPVCQSDACDAACAALNAATVPSDCGGCGEPLTVDVTAAAVICPVCDERMAIADDTDAPDAAGIARPIPTTPRRTGKTNFFPRKASSFAVTDLTGADAATMAATVARDFGRFLGGR